MQLITSYDAYTALLDAHRSAYGRLNHNNYHLSDELHALIRDARLSFHICGDVLVLLLRNSGYDDLIYYLPSAPKTEFDCSVLTRPTLISVVFTRQTDRLQQAESYWQTQGFRFYKASRFMTLDVRDIPLPRHTVMLASARAEAEDFAALIADSFYAYGDGVPDAETVWQDIQNGLVRKCIAKPEDVVAGYMRTAAPQGNHTYNENIVIRPEFQGRGYARALFQSFADWCRTLDIQYMTLWVNRGNTVAEQLYTSIGYVCSGKESRQYLYIPADQKTGGSQ